MSDPRAPAAPPVDLAALILHTRRQGDPAPLLAAIPYAAFLGLTAAAEGDALTARLVYTPALVGNPALPALHGGVLGALLETAAILQLLWAHTPHGLPKTITLTIEYLRSARPVDTLARAEIVRRGRRVAALRVVAWQDDPARPVAAANVHCLLPSGADLPAGDAG